jgi:hypothetical protein
MSLCAEGKEFPRARLRREKSSRAQRRLACLACSYDRTELPRTYSDGWFGCVWLVRGFQRDTFCTKSLVRLRTGPSRSSGQLHPCTACMCVPTAHINMRSALSVTCMEWARSSASREGKVQLKQPELVNGNGDREDLISYCLLTEATVRGESYPVRYRYVCTCRERRGRPYQYVLDSCGPSDQVDFWNERAEKKTYGTGRHRSSY